MLQSLSLSAITDKRPYLLPGLLALAFVPVIFHFSLQDFSGYYYLALILIMVGMVQYFPLSSSTTEWLVFLCLPMVGAIANVQARCLTYNSIVLFLTCRSFAISGTYKPRHFLAYLLVIASWIFYYEPEANSIIYGGALMHGVVHPLHFFFLTRKRRFFHYLVFVIPVTWGLINLLVYKQLFTAFWDLEIFAVYFFWHLGFNKQTVVKRLLLLSLPLITFSQMYWPICPGKGKLIDLVKETFSAYILPLFS